MRHHFRMSLMMFLVLFLLLLAGCAKKTTFVLMPDPDGTVGQIEVSTKGGTQVVSSAAFATEVTSSEEAPSPPEKMDAQTIQEKFGMALAADPGRPAFFSLYFESGTNRLTPESRKWMDEIIEAIAARRSTDISVVGHTDRVGAADLNHRLSLKRAQAVKELLEKKGVEPEIIHLDAHGESNPLIKTADEVAEPRNRRVDVTVR